MAYKREYGQMAIRYTAQYLEQISLKVRKGSKDRLRAEAEAHGMSMNELICNAVNDYCGKIVISTYKKDL